MHLYEFHHVMTADALLYISDTQCTRYEGCGNMTTNVVKRLGNMTMNIRVHVKHFCVPSK